MPDDRLVLTFLEGYMVLTEVQGVSLNGACSTALNPGISFLLAQFNNSSKEHVSSSQACHVAVLNKAYLGALGMVELNPSRCEPRWEVTTAELPVDLCLSRGYLSYFIWHP